ncbi:MAG: hypothetical protein J6Y74_03430 [Clostridia bacterium]|nr:hypothetical protein [Clostridia bacterium]
MAGIKTDVRAMNALSKAMKDIVVDKKEDSIFYEYEDKGVIGKKILEALLAKRKTSENGNSFDFSDSIKQSGLLSVTQVLQTVLILINDYKIECTEEVLSLCDDLVKELFAHVENPKGNYSLFYDEGIPAKDIPEGNFLLDATPYDVTFPACFSYIDSITWTLPVALDLLRTNLTAGVEFFDKATEKKLIALSKFCVKYLNLAFVATPQSSKMSCGWNFTWKCVNPSLYYTYAVGECFQSVKANYEEYVDAKTGAPLSETESGKRFAAILVEINDDLPYGDPTSPVGRLRNDLLKAAEGVWEVTQDRIDDRFFNYDLSVVDDETVRHSQSSDVLFNMVFIVNIVISSGLNEVLKEKVQKAVGADREKYQKEYDDMFELLQLAIQRTSRFYNDLKAVGRDYIVDQYYAVFNEDYVYHKVLAKELRKRRIRMMSLLPVIISTFTLLGEYMVKYPQIDMIKYLDSMMSDRILDENGQYTWLWEKDCYYATSTYYYVSSLAGFYRYYETYESRFSKIDTENNAYKARIQEAQYTALTAEGGEIEKLKKEIARLQAENAEQAAKIAAGSPVENAIADLCKNSIRENLLPAFNDLLSGILTSMDPAEGKRLSKEEKAFSENMKLLLVRSLFGAETYETAGDCKEDLDGKNQKDAYNKLVNYLRKDIRTILALYVGQVTKSVTHASDFVVTQGYDGIRSALSRKKD